jgi:hypothetical protein
MQQRQKLKDEERRLHGAPVWLCQLRESRTTFSRLEQEIATAQQALEVFALQRQRLQKHQQLQLFQSQWQALQKQAKQNKFTHQPMQNDLSVKQQEVHHLEENTQQDQKCLQEQPYQQLAEPIRLALEVDAQIRTKQVLWESRQ